MKTKKLSRQARSLAGRLLLRMIGAATLYTFAGVAAYLVAWTFFGQFTWQGDELLYRIGKWVELRTSLFAFLYIIIGYAAIFAYFWRKPFLYLSELAEATESAYRMEEGMIELPGPLQEYEVEINALKVKMQDSERAARAAEQRKNDLVVYLAHDLKTPLTSVIGYLTLLRDEGEISPELREKYLSIALAKAERLEDLINEFFEITRFNLTSLTLEISRVNLTRMLEQIIFEFQPMFAEKHLTCTLYARPDVQIKCDVDKMQRVFDNLLRNAVNYSFPFTEIEVRVSRLEKGMSVEVVNHGNTIPPEKLERIFEQFYRLDTARTSRSGGAGLGLAIAKEIVNLHGGSITAASENEIISFTITLPYR